MDEGACADCKYRVEDDEGVIMDCQKHMLIMEDGCLGYMANVPIAKRSYDCTQYGTLYQVDPSVHQWLITWDNRREEYVYVGEKKDAETIADELKKKAGHTSKARIKEITGYKTGGKKK